jgi:hypothetical protein
MITQDNESWTTYQRMLGEAADALGAPGAPSWPELLERMRALAKPTIDPDLFERLAALEHERWAHWTEHMLAVLSPLLPFDPAWVFGRPGWKRTPETYQKACTAITRWRRQLAHYSTLTEQEKDSDREWARKVLDLLQVPHGPR